MVVSSGDVVWQVVNRFNSKLINRDGVRFTTEAGNLTHKHTFRASGLANYNSVGITASSKGVVVRTAISRRHRKVASSKRVRRVHTDSAKVANRSVAGILSTFRPDLKKDALARVTRLYEVRRIKERSAQWNKKKAAKK